MNSYDAVETRVVAGELRGGGEYGVFKIEIRVNVPEGYELSEAENNACWNAKEAIHAAFMEERIKRDPAASETARIQRESLLGLFPDKIFVEELPNGYCSRHCCKHLAWFKVTTTKGRITVGWRKRVINIEWEPSVAGRADIIFGAEAVTKGDRSIHAWGYDKAREYIAKLLT
jgi:hypothetical protein